MCFVKSQPVLVRIATLTFWGQGGLLKGVSLSLGSEVEGPGVRLFREVRERSEVWPVQEEGPRMEELWRVQEKDPSKPRHRGSTS